MNSRIKLYNNDVFHHVEIYVETSLTNGKHCIVNDIKSTKTKELNRESCETGGNL